MIGEIRTLFSGFPEILQAPQAEQSRRQCRKDGSTALCQRASLEHVTQYRTTRRDVVKGWLAIFARNQIQSFARLWKAEIARVEHLPRDVEAAGFECAAKELELGLAQCEKASHVLDDYERRARRVEDVRQCVAHVAVGVHGAVDSLHAAREWLTREPTADNVARWPESGVQAAKLRRFREIRSIARDRCGVDLAKADAFETKCMRRDVEAADAGAYVHESAR